MRVFRLHKTRYLDAAFAGVGSRLVGGRWNSPGRSVVYTSEHPATAVLEVLVHAQRPQLLQESYVMVSAALDEAFIRTLDAAALPKGWDRLDDLAAAQTIGDTWYDERVSVALRVPSVVLRGESNILLNPEHADWNRVEQPAPEAFLFDPRLTD